MMERAKLAEVTTRLAARQHLCLLGAVMAARELLLRRAVRRWPGGHATEIAYRDFPYCPETFVRNCEILAQEPVQRGAFLFQVDRATVNNVGLKVHEQMAGICGWVEGKPE